MNKVMVAFIIITSSTTRIFVNTESNECFAKQDKQSGRHLFSNDGEEVIQLLFSHSNNINIMKDYYTRRVISLQQ